MSLILYHNNKLYADFLGISESYQNTQGYRETFSGNINYFPKKMAKSFLSQDNTFMFAYCGDSVSWLTFSENNDPQCEDGAAAILKEFATAIETVTLNNNGVFVLTQVPKDIMDRVTVLLGDRSYMLMTKHCVIVQEEVKGVTEPSQLNQDTTYGLGSRANSAVTLIRLGYSVTTAITASRVSDSLSYLTADATDTVWSFSQEMLSGIVKPKPKRKPKSK